MLNVITELKKHHFLKNIDEYTFVKSKSNSINEKVINYTSVNSALVTYVAKEFSNDEIEFKFKEVGVMLDVSRGPVYTVDFMKKRIRQFALLGYNQIQLYAEDVYEADVPYFGYLRGKYTKQEIKTLVEYAKIFEIEIIPCVQVLGHLEQFLSWRINNNIKDTPSVLLCKSDETYDFLDKILSSLKELFQTDKINIGMDEAFDLGRGSFIQKYGFHNQTSIFYEHLEIVRELCHKNGFNKIKMWSDMFFEILKNKNSDNSLGEMEVTELYKEVVKPDIEICYWNYWSTNINEYDTMLDRHYKITNNVSSALGINQWGVPSFVPSMDICSKLLLESSRKHKVDNILFTVWNDDGGYVNHETTTLGILSRSEMTFGYNACDDAYKMIFGYDKNFMLKLCNISMLKIDTAALMWDDPLYQIYLKNLSINNNIEEYEKQLSEKLVISGDQSKASYRYGLALNKYLVTKLNLNHKLLKNGLDFISVDEILKMLNIITNVEDTFRDQWLETNKYQGMEVIQMRYAALKMRYEELLRRKLNCEPTPELCEIETVETPLDSNFQHIFFPSVSRWT